MIFTAHRINTIKELTQIPADNGIEIDIRDYLNKLILSHDPFKKGLSFDKFLAFYKHKFIIINVKSEGIEEKIFKILKKRKIKNYFFLDSSFPFLVKYSKNLTKKFAIRVSDLESYKTSFNLETKVNWIWLDCFKKFQISSKLLKKMKKLKYKICIVSPGLHGRKITKKDINFFNKNKAYIDMVCDKKERFGIWKKLFRN